MADVSVLEADNKGAEFRQRQPQRHLPLEHAALASPTAFASDDERNFGAVRLGAPQEAEQRGMGLALRQSMQVEAGVDGVVAPRHALLEAAVEWCERR